MLDLFCRKEGNLFNATSAPESQPPAAPAPPLSTPTLVPPGSRAPPFFIRSPPTDGPPGKQADGPSTQEGPSSASAKKSFSTKRIVGIAIAGVLIVIIVIFGFVLFMLRCCERRQGDYGITKRHERGASSVPVEKPKELQGRPTHQIEKGNFVFVQDAI